MYTEYLKRYSYPYIAVDRPLDAQEVEVPRILSNQHMKVVSHMHWLRSPPKRCPWLSFQSQAELTPGP